MGRVHIRLDLEGHGREFRLVGRYLPGGRLPGFGGGREFHKGVQEFLHPEVVDGAAEEHGRLLALEIAFPVKGVACPFQEFQIHAQFIGMVTQKFVQLGIVQIGDDDALLDFPPVGGGKQVELFLVDVIGSLELFAHADGPGQGRAFDVQGFFDVLEDVQGIEAVPVQLVHKGHDGGVAHAADVHELAGLDLDTLGAIDDHEGRVHGREHPVGVFGKILMAGGVQEIDLVVLVIEFHHRRGHGDAALLLHGHPVGGGVPVGLAGFDGPGNLDGASVEQEFFGQSGLAGIGMADDPEGSASVHLFGELLDGNI